MYYILIQSAKVVLKCVNNNLSLLVYNITQWVLGRYHTCVAGLPILYELLHDGAL